MQKRTKINTLIFDFDGTLADTEQVNFSIMNKLAQQYHFNKMTLDDMQHLKTLSAKDVLKFFQIPWYKTPYILYQGKKRLRQQITTVQTFRHLPQLLVTLKEHYQLGIVTTNSKNNINKFLNNNSLDFFNFISCNAKLLGKERALQKVITQQKLDINNTLYIGDEIRDIIAAHQCKLAIIAVSWGYNSIAALQRQHPNYLVNSVDELKLAIDDFFVNKKLSI
ncbi:MAG: phosphoglycolate phosphatase [Alteromonadaceae bacterium]|jgi:phosphoglycolate phosphatase